MQLKSFIQNEILNFLHLTIMANLSPITLIKLFLFFLTLLVGFFFQFEGSLVYCFHAKFVFDFVVDVVLIVVYAPRVIWVRLKLTFTCFSL